MRFVNENENGLFELEVFGTGVNYSGTSRK